jgi:HEPN domain-containing protein
MADAKGDLEHARHSAAAADFNWACFAAQQAAEKAVKALHLLHGTVAWGHSVFELLQALPESTGVNEELLEAAVNLDRCYIPTRYADAHPAGPARRHYTKANAREAVGQAEKVVNWCDENLSRGS